MSNFNYRGLNAVISSHCQPGLLSSPVCSLSDASKAKAASKEREHRAASAGGGDQSLPRPCWALVAKRPLESAFNFCLDHRCKRPSP